MGKDKKDPKPKDTNSALYDEYVKGASPQALADKYDLDTDKVVSIIESKQGV